MNDTEYAVKTRQLLLKANLTLQEKIVNGLLVDFLLEDDAKRKNSARETINDIVGAYSSQVLFSEKPSLQVPQIHSPEQIKIGRYAQGDKLYGNFSISVDDLQHAGIFTATGFGKTTLIARIVTQLIDLKIPWLAFDFKRDLRGLSREYNVKVLRWNWLKINPLQPPPDVELKQWMTFLADIMAHVFGWFHASENYLMEFMQRAYESKADGYPTFRLLHDMVATNEESGRRYSEYREVVLNRLASMLIVLGDVANAETSFPIEKLFDENVVIELDGLRRDEANFLVEYFLAYIFAYRLAHNQRGRIAHVDVFDEASRFFFKGKQFGETRQELGLSFLETVPQIIRDYKEGLLCAAQEPSLITHSLMSNLRTKFVGYLSEGEDSETIGTSLNLNDDEKEEFAKLGERGYWLVKMAGTKPFVVKSEDFPIPKDMTDDELKEKMSGFVAELESSRKIVPLPHHSKVLEQPKVIPPQLTSEAWDLLVNVCEHPFMGIRSRRYALKISGRRIETAMEELAERKLTVAMDIPLGRFRPTKFLILTDEALNLLSNVKHDVSLHRKIGRVGFEHSLYQVLVAYAFRKKGWDAQIEKDMDGKRLDVLIQNNGTKIGIEVELTTADLENKVTGIEKLDKLVFLVRDRQVKTDFQRRIAGLACRNKIEVFEVRNFLASIDYRIDHGTHGTKPFDTEQTDSSTLAE
jgi:hypothetical protein